MCCAWPLTRAGWLGGGLGNAGVPPAFGFWMRARCLRYRWVHRLFVLLGRAMAVADKLESKLCPYTFLVTRRIPQAGMDILRAAGEVVVNEQDRKLASAELLEMGKSCDGWLTMLTDIIDGALIRQCSKLRGIANYAVGHNNIDISTCTQMHIGVSNTPDVLTDATAEIAFALILSTARRIVEADKFLRSGQWTGWAPMQFLGTDISNQTLGIVGAGRIGSRVAEMAAGFNESYCHDSGPPARQCGQPGSLGFQVTHCFNRIYCRCSGLERRDRLVL